jgi:hypothetical protein
MVNIRRYKPIAPGDWSSLFGSPQLLDGEDAAAYDSLSAQVRAAVKPLDVIEEMFVTDVVSLTWEVQRWRRLKSRLLRARGIEELEAFLGRELDYDNYREEFEFSLSEILEQYVSRRRSWRISARDISKAPSTRSINCLLTDRRVLTKSWTARKPTKPNRSQEIIRGTIRAPSRRSMSFSLPMA